MATTDTDWAQVATTDDLDDEGRTLVNVDGRAILIVDHEDRLYAVDNRCPHMGFPLHRGTVDEGVLTCHWHHARFELSCGDTFDPWADDVQSFPVELRGEEIWVDPDPEPAKPPEEHWKDRLADGLQENIRLVIAKSVIGLFDADVPYAEPLAVGVGFGTEYREDGWGQGLTIHACMANLVEELEPEDRKRALYTGLLSVADDTNGEPPKFDQEPFETDSVTPDRVEDWFRECVEVRDEDGAERCLRTAIANDYGPERIAAMLYDAATDHRYMQGGHTFDFINKAIETLDHVGWEHADQVLPSVIPRLTTATRSEELSSWRQPIDIAALLAETYEDIEELAAAGEGEAWTEPDDFTETLLSDDPHAIVDALTDAARAGATAEELAACVARAAARRVAQFGTSNEFNDWNTVLHTFTYANAVHHATRRTDTPELLRGVLDGAMSVYLDRFLNMPPATIPEDAASDRDAAEIRDDLLERFDEEGGVDEAGALVAEYLDSGGDPAELKRTLGHALLREDAGFHTLQCLEAGFAQFDLAGDEEGRRVALIAAARYLAAHFPTRREREQTFTIAARLNRGDRIHE